jgi:hypothetical protein
MEVRHGGRLDLFRVRYLLPVAIAVQCFIEESQLEAGADEVVP